MRTFLDRTRVHLQMRKKIKNMKLDEMEKVHARTLENGKKDFTTKGHDLMNPEQFLNNLREYFSSRKT